MGLVGICAVLGLVVGSFLNVVIHRVPRHESLIRPRSRCPNCETEIRERDNIPVLSWILLRGRCRHCSTPISPRYPIIELLTAVLFALAALRFELSVELPAFGMLFAVLLSVTAIDIELRIIPKRIVWFSMGVGLALFSISAIADGRPGRLFGAAGGAGAAFLFFFVIHLISPRGMGFGDVRLAAVLGLFLGWLSLWHVGLGLFLGFVSGGVAGVAAVVAGRSRKSALPFAPFLSLGAVIAVLVGTPILDWYLHVG